MLNAIGVSSNGLAIRVSRNGGQFNIGMAGRRPTFVTLADFTDPTYPDGFANYYMGSDPSKWLTNVPTFGKVAYQNVYDGIDLVYYGNQRQLEYDFVVAPGVDPGKVTLAFDGLSAKSGALPPGSRFGRARCARREARRAPPCWRRPASAAP